MNATARGSVFLGGESKTAEKWQWNETRGDREFSLATNRRINSIGEDRRRERDNIVAVAGPDNNRNVSVW